MTKSCVQKHPRFRIPRFCTLSYVPAAQNAQIDKFTKQVPDPGFGLKSVEQAIKTNSTQMEHRYAQDVHKLRKARQEGRSWLHEETRNLGGEVD